MQAIVTPHEMGLIDAAAPEPVEVLIGRAGWAVAREAISMLGGTYGRRVVVVAGKGNNGADGREAARLLQRRGVRVTVLDASGLGPTDVLPPADLLIDAAYGTGFRGTWNPPPLPDAPPPAVLAVDVPSGVSGLTGEASGRPWPAARTVTFAALKPGLLQGDGPSLAGVVGVADIGLDVSSARAHKVDADAVRSWLPARPRDTHKWRGAVWVVAGSPGMTGAADLATRAAQRAGAGYVRLSTPGVDPSQADPGRPTEAVVVALTGGGWAEQVLAEGGRFAALAVGPGLGTGDAVAEQVRALVSATPLATVVDGDGLRALGTEVGPLLARRPSGAPPVVLTPHDGEFEFLSGERPGADRFAAARSLAAASGAVVLLKGPTTVVASPDGSVLVSDEGDARLATAGTGDVLTGVVAAFLAQGLAPSEAAAAAAFVHGRAARVAGPVGLVAGDLPPVIPSVIAALG